MAFTPVVTQITGTASAAGVSAEALRAAAAGLTGEIRQVPPAVSAIKVGGQRAYRLTRAGAAPEQSILASQPWPPVDFRIWSSAPSSALMG